MAWKSLKAIREGKSNELAHEGDTLEDAMLFDRDQRTDRRIYRGITCTAQKPQIMNEISDFRTRQQNTGRNTMASAVLSNIFHKEHSNAYRI